MALNVQQKRIANFLAQGLRPGQIATIVGVSPAYISQLCGDDGPEEFKETVKAVAGEVAREVDEDQIISNKYLATEHKLLQAIENSLVNAEFPQLVQALKVIGERQERRAARKVGLINPQQIGVVQNNITVLQVPAHAVPEYQVNGQGQVMAIGSQVMSPLSSQGVKELFRARREGQKLVQGETLEAEPKAHEQQIGNTVPEDF